MGEADATTRTSYITCPLCEATCGLEVTSGGRETLAIRGDREDVFSHGYLCPKAYSLKELDGDPDRLRTPMIREGDTWREATWEEAFAAAERGLGPILREHGRDAVAAFAGNPNVHNLSGLLYTPAFLQTLGSLNTYTASTLDQMPKQVSAGLMFGTGLTIPIPDVDRAQFLLILGANPLVSNGSLMTAPGMRDRLRAMRARGGKVIVVDPRRTRTAEEADEHHFIRPATDALFLFALVRTLFAEGLARPGRLAEHLTSIEEVRALAAEFTPETVAPICGIAPETIRRIARELAATEAGAVYCRIGTCTQEFGTLANWLVDVLNALTGNLDREGGAMFPTPAAGARNTQGTPGRGSGIKIGPKRSRVRGLPQVFGELPTVCLAEEILRPGEGQVRALVTIAGNPILSAPDAQRLDAALASLEFMVSVDCYLNETTRHAHVILPPPSPLERDHYDLAFYQLSVRNIARYSKAVFPRPDGQPEEWQIMARLIGIVAGQGAGADPAVVDGFIAHQLISRETRLEGSPIEGREPMEILSLLEPLRGPRRLLDFLIRVGPYGDGFGSRPDGLTLEKVAAAPHGLDLGPLRPRIPEALRTRSGKIELAPEPIVADVERLCASLSRIPSPLVLIGRRELRTNNSWMHNLNVLVKGPSDCVLHIHHSDAAQYGLTDGAEAEVISASGTIRVSVGVTDKIMPGVVSLPHGWGHDLPGTRLGVAREHAGVNVNLLISGDQVDPLSGNAIQNGVPVTLRPVERATMVGVATTEGEAASGS
ncbi:MAG TPA: molybdopterin-dependent oxidoreductase [Ktedonobacterales bacterium]